MELLSLKLFSPGGDGGLVGEKIGLEKMIPKIATKFVLRDISAFNVY